MVKIVHNDIIEYYNVPCNKCIYKPIKSLS